MNAIPASPEQEQNPAELTGRQALLQEIGCKLSQSRSASGESIEEAVRKLKIRKSQLQALENGDWQKMPDDVYVLGFLRQYSQYLGIDISDETHRLKNDQYALTKPLTFPDPPVAPSRRWAWITGAAFVLLFILFNITTETKNIHHHDVVESPEHAATGEAIAEPADAADSKPSTHSNETIADSFKPITPDSAAETQSVEPPAKVSVTHATAVINGAVTETPVSKKAAPAGQSVSEMISVSEPELVDSQGKPATATVQAQVTNATMHHFRFDAVGSPVWLQISRPDASGAGKGGLLKEVLLQPGLHTTIHAPTESLWITCGNAPALRISVDGTVFAAPGSLGIGKKVLRDYRFSIASHKSVGDN